VVGTSETNQVDLIIDVQSELYRLKTKEKFTLALASTLDLTGKPDPKSWNPSNEPSLLDKYEYGMYGKIFKVDPADNSRVVIYVSHGGLMMKITGDSSKLREVKQDERVYTLLRRVQAQ
jgi:DNA-directed RNA polymerase I, II, and III subunit RPABC3